MRGVATVAGFELQYAGAIARRPGHRRMLGLVGKAQIDHALEIESMKPLERRRAELAYLPASKQAARGATAALARGPIADIATIDELFHHRPPLPGQNLPPPDKPTRP